MNKFEYDLLNTMYKYDGNIKFRVSWELMDMKQKGYYESVDVEKGLLEIINEAKCVYVNEFNKLK